jgi:hypothetical protein
MISRQWRGLAEPAFANAYVEHLQSETFPAIRKLPGFLGASILTSVDAIRAFAGANAETAVVSPKVHDMMVDYDRVVRHYEVVP